MKTWGGKASPTFTLKGGFMKEPKLEVNIQISKKMGEDLIRQALNKRLEAKKAQVVGEVNTFMERLEVMTRLQDKTDRRVQFLKDQLAAINLGKFTTHEHTGRIVFDDDELNTDWNETERW